MKTGKNCTMRRPVLPAAALAGLLLAGCSSGHIGDSWQCPLAAGGACNSVAAADPAVPDAGATRDPVLKEPLWRVRAKEEVPAERPCAADCGAGFDPFGWLMRLFGADASEGEAGSADGAAQVPAAPPAPAAEPSSSTAGETAAASAGPPNAGAQPEEPDGAALPAEPASAKDDPAADGLRTGEAVARIWIAPFVDADGVYREASHVRVVLEPAGWRIP